MQKTSILLINLGTPDNYDTQSVRRYLKEFLSDPRVVDLPSPVRWLLLNTVILPFRPKKASEAYQKIWLDAGSPLLVHGKVLEAALAMRLGPDYQVALGMRYGNPSMTAVLESLKTCHRLIILPLFPQYASATTGSALEKCLSLLSKEWNIPEIRTIGDFYAHPGFIKAYATLIQRAIEKKPVDLLLFSYHSLPERHIDKSGCMAVCTHNDDCPAIDTSNQYCYRAQCYTTSRALAEAMGITQDQYRVSFQSRLGKIPWIKPYTDVLLSELRRENIRHIAVACPSFVADCLETLEEIDIRGRAQWQALGGETFITVPCLNAEAVWVEALAQMITQN